MMPRRLRRSAPPPHHRRGIERKRKPRSDFATKQRRLVKSPPPKPPPMQRHRNHHIIILSRNRQFVTKKLRKRAPNRLIKSVLVTTNQRGQTPRLILGSSAIARDSPRDPIMRPTRKASRTTRRAASHRLQKPTANLATRIRNPLDLLDAPRTNAPPLPQPRSLPTSRTTRRIKKIKYLHEPSHNR